MLKKVMSAGRKNSFDRALQIPSVLGNPPKLCVKGNHFVDVPMFKTTALDHDVAVFGTKQGKVVVSSLETGAEVFTSFLSSENYPESIYTISADERTIVARQNRKVVVIDRETHKTVRDLPVMEPIVMVDHGLFLMRDSGHQAVIHNVLASKSAPAVCLKGLDPDMLVRFAVNGDKSLGVSLTTDETLRVWDMASGRCVHTLALTASTELGSSPLAYFEVAAHQVLLVLEDSHLVVWNPAEGSFGMVRPHRDVTSVDAPNIVAVWGNGDRIVTGGVSDGTIKVWDSRTLVLVEEHTYGSHVTCFQVDEAEGIIYSGHFNGNVMSWHTGSNYETTLTSHPDEVRELILKPPFLLSRSMADWTAHIGMTQLAIKD